jgi:L-cysteine:1D-myo-inositol 2-amino-2-deoxy-alpha-D-glucopyranoside ligase
MDSWRAAVVPELPGRGPETLLTDSATGELVQAAAERAATLYACGITPYDATHIGHAATFLAWDLLVRAWRDAGHEVSYVQNVTDVDDPLLERAARDGEDWRALADREIARYRSDMEALRLLPPTHLIGAVEALPDIEQFTSLLADRGALYDLDGDLYFSRACDGAFGSVSGLDRGQMLVLSAERGGDPGRPGKKDPLDALVWLAARPGEPAWEAPFGPGRPGWHVECAAIATRYLGRVFDVQAGGTDLIFPHHELSASHARVALREGMPAIAGWGAGGAAAAADADGGGGGGAFARHYAHAGMVRLDGEKMSKSLGNLVFVSSLLAEGTDPMAVRLAILAHGYRHDWDWTQPGLAAAVERLARWRQAVRTASAGPVPAGPVPGGPGPGRAAWSVPSAESVLAAVRERLAEDLDAPGALAVVDRWADAVIAAGSTAPVTADADSTSPADGDEADSLGRRAGTARSSRSPAQLVRDTVDALLGIAL